MASDCRVGASTSVADRRGTKAGFGAPGAEGSSQDFAAAWSPDGASIVFVATTGANTAAYASVSTHLFSVPAGGGEPRALTSGQSSESAPRFSPDGRTLCFKQGREWGTIYALDRLACAPWPWTGAATTLTGGFDRSVGDFAMAADGRVWLVDPVDGPGLEERVRALGEPAGVLQLVDRHPRDCAVLAARLGVEHLRVPAAGVAGSPFQVRRILDVPWWREVALL